jgi:Flp pilus assembly protein TadB
MSTAPRRRETPRTESITRARTGLTQDLHGRQRRYLIAMLVRTACVVLMAVTWSRWPVVAACALVGAALIPYLAVVVAQAGWRQQRGTRPELTPLRPQSASVPRTVLEPTRILPPEHDSAA